MCASWARPSSVLSHTPSCSWDTMAHRPRCHLHTMPPYPSACVACQQVAGGDQGEEREVPIK